MVDTQRDKNAEQKNVLNSFNPNNIGEGEGGSHDNKTALIQQISLFDTA